VVIDEPPHGTRAVLKAEAFPPGPTFKGVGIGDVNLLCGGCGFKVAENLANANQLGNLVLVCNACGAFNETRV